MPLYEFKCNDCSHEWEELAKFDSTGKYPQVHCPECESKNKEQMMGLISIGGPTAAKMGNFNYRAGFNMNKAQGERRAAEAASHMGSTPYVDTSVKDFNMGEGVHDPETRSGLT